MNVIGKCAYIGNRIIDIIVILMAVIMFLFGAYSLYDVFHVYKGASLSSEILKNAPGTAGNENDAVNVEALFEKYPDMRAWLNIFGIILLSPPPPPLHGGSMSRLAKSYVLRGGT